MPDIEHDDHESTILEAEDDPVVADAESVPSVPTFELSHIAMAGRGVAVNAAPDSPSDLSG